VHFIIYYAVGQLAHFSIEAHISSWVNFLGYSCSFCAHFFKI